MPAPVLDPRDTRELTNRECAKLLGGTIGALCEMSDAQTVRDAVRWWAEKDEAWRTWEGADEESPVVAGSVRNGHADCE